MKEGAGGRPCGERSPVWLRARKRAGCSSQTLADSPPPAQAAPPRCGCLAAHPSPLQFLWIGVRPYPRALTLPLSVPPLPYSSSDHVRNTPGASSMIPSYHTQHRSPHTLRHQPLPLQSRFLPSTPHRMNHLACTTFSTYYSLHTENTPVHSVSTHHTQVQNTTHTRSYGTTPVFRLTRRTKKCTCEVRCTTDFPVQHPHIHCTQIM